jgi:hypothetical protein
MAVRGRKPKGVQHHTLRGTYRPSRHGPKPEEMGSRAAELAAATALSPEQQAERQREIAEQMRRIKGT